MSYAPRQLLGFLLFSLVFAGCPKRELDAKATCAQFLTDIRTRRGDAAFAKLSEGTQTELRRRHLALAKASGADPEASPAYLVFRTLDLELMSSPESIVEASRPDPAEVRLRVSVKNGQSADIRMVREGDAWKIDLFEALVPVDPRTTTSTAR